MKDIQSEWFEHWFDSHYYHLLYKKRSSEEANHFVEKIVDLLELNAGDTLLDLACGKGRHSIAFAQFGPDVTGVDLSKESIDYARQFEHKTLHFFVHDMRQVFRSAYFDVVCNLFTSFGYFKSARDNEQAAASIFSALKKQGKFLIDFVNSNHAIRNIEAHKKETVVTDGVTFHIERIYTEGKFLKKIQIIDGDRKLDFQESVNSFTLTQMADLFESAGLTLLQQFGNYHLDAYHETDSPRMILLFQK